MDPMYNPNSIEDYDLLKLISKNQPDYVIINLGGGVQEVLGYFLKKLLQILKYFVLVVQYPILLVSKHQ